MQHSEKSAANFKMSMKSTAWVGRTKTNKSSAGGDYRVAVSIPAEMWYDAGRRDMLEPPEPFFAVSFTLKVTTGNNRSAAVTSILHRVLPTAYTGRAIPKTASGYYQQIPQPLLYSYWELSETQADNTKAISIIIGLLFMTCCIIFCRRFLITMWEPTVINESRSSSILWGCIDYKKSSASA